MNGDAQWYGLLIFGLVVSLNTVGLTLDASLALNNLPTVTDWARVNPWIATAILAINATGLVGLAIHFTNFPR